MGNVSAQLGRALGTGAAQESTVLIPDHLCTANRTSVRQKIGLGVFRALTQVHPQNLRDDLPCLADAHRITDAHIQARNEVLVMECGVGDGGTGQTDGRYYSLGGQYAGAAHLNHNVLYHSGLHFRRVFIGHSPPGKFRSGTQQFPLGQIIQLDNTAIDVTGKFFPFLVDAKNLFFNFLGVRQFFIGNDLKAEAFQIFQGLAVAGEGDTLCQLHIKHQNIQLPLGGDLRIFLPQGACRRVSGIGKGLLSVFFQRGVQGAKGLLGHIHLSPDNEPGRGVFQSHRDGADGFQIFRYVLPHYTVSPGSATDKTAVLVFQGHGEAIDFRLNRVGGVGQGFLGSI